MKETKSLPHPKKGLTSNLFKTQCLLYRSCHRRSTNFR